MKEQDCFPLDEISFKDPQYSRFADREQPDLNAHLELRSCADCAGYAPIGTMITMNDSRVICKTCWRNLKKRTAKKAQPDIFAPVAQPSLF